MLGALVKTEMLSSNFVLRQNSETCSSQVLETEMLESGLC